MIRAAEYGGEDAEELGGAAEEQNEKTKKIFSGPMTGAFLCTSFAIHCSIAGSRP